MSDPGPVTTATPRNGNGSRYLFLFLLGLVIGIVATVMAVRALNERKDHFPESVMHVQQWHLGQLKGNVEQNRCVPIDTLPHLQALRTMVNDIEPAFPGLRDDKRFAEHAGKLRGSLDGALASPPLSCEGVTKLVATVGEGCKACHQDFRN
jgi:hypothetical protein